LGFTSNWILDFYGGFAYRSRNNIIVNERLDLTSLEYTYTVTEKSDNVPAFFLGMKVGLGF